MNLMSSRSVTSRFLSLAFFETKPDLKLPFHLCGCYLTPLRQHSCYCNKKLGSAWVILPSVPFVVGAQTEQLLAFLILQLQMVLSYQKGCGPYGIPISPAVTSAAGRPRRWLEARRRSWTYLDLLGLPVERHPVQERPAAN